MKTIQKSAKLANVCYDIRGPIMDRARQMEEDGHKIIKLNIGNLAVFGFDAPEEIQQDMIRNLPNSAGYSDSKGIFAARKAVMHETQKQGILGVTLDDIYLGNGASELIVMATNGLLDDGDELLLPSPDYPLWTAAASLSGGTPVHYHCDEANGWMPDLADIRAKVTPRTKGIVVINPNNPTGALYADELLLGIVAIALMAGLRSTDALSKNASRQSTQWLAQMCAENEFSRLRLSRQVPPVGESSTSCLQAGLELQVNLTVQVTPNPNFRRVDARVVQRNGSESTPLLQLSTVMGRY